MKMMILTEGQLARNLAINCHRRQDHRDYEEDDYIEPGPFSLLWASRLDKYMLTMIIDGRH